MKNVIALSVVSLSILIIGCGYSQSFKNSARDFLKYATIMNTKINDNAPVIVINKLAIDSLTRWATLEAEWPDNKLVDTKNNISLAMKSITLFLESLGIAQNNVFEVYQGSSNWNSFANYPAVGQLKLKTKGNKKYYDIPENLTIILEIYKKEMEKGLSGLSKAIK